MTRQYLHQLRRQAAGLCLKCTRKRVSSWLCKVHLLEARDRRERTGTRRQRGCGRKAGSGHTGALAAVVATLGPSRPGSRPKLAQLNPALENPRLSPREREVLAYLVLGYTRKETAARLGIAERTVSGHRERIIRKTAERGWETRPSA